MAALIGLAHPDCLTLVWMLSVRLRDASIADICWGSVRAAGVVILLLSPGFTPRSWLVAALITLWGARPRTSSRDHGQGGSTLPGDARLAWIGVLVAQPVHGLLAAGRAPLVRRPPAARRGARHAVRRLTLSMAGSSVRGRIWLRGRGRLSTRALQGRALEPRQGARLRAMALHAASELLRRRHAVVGPVCDGGINARRMAHRAEPGPHDAVADARVRGDAVEDGLKASKPGYRAYIARTAAFFPCRTLSSGSNSRSALPARGRTSSIPSSKLRLSSSSDEWVLVLKTSMLATGIDTSTITEEYRAQISK